MHKGAPANYIRLKNLVIEFLDPKTKDRNFDARNNRVARESKNERKGDERRKSEERHDRILISGWFKHGAPKKTHAVSNMT